MKSKGKYYQLVPAKILENLTEIQPHFKNIPGFSSDNLKQVISVIAFHVRKNEDNWAKLKMTYLRKIVPQADAYLKVLKELNIIERSGKPIKGVTSFKYRFTSGFESKYQKLPLSNPKLIRRIENSQKSLKKRNSKKYPNQNRFIRQLTIEPDSLKYINEQYSANIEKYNYATASVTRIMNGELYYKVDKTSGRYHSNLTNLPSDLRQYVTINGNHLVNVDIKNCQPYLSTLILTNPLEASYYTNNTSFSLLLKNLQVKQTEDVKRYISLVSDGRFYEYFIDKFEEHRYKFTTTEKRQEAKKKLLIILFDRNVHNPQYRQIFAELFPEVHRIFSIVRGNDKGNKFSNFKRFSILLQTIESHLILNVILPKIYKTDPNIIAVTVHDSVMTTIATNHSRIVYKIMHDELKKFVGLSPKLKKS